MRRAPCEFSKPHFDHLLSRGDPYKFLAVLLNWMEFEMSDSLSKEAEEARPKPACVQIQRQMALRSRFLSSRFKAVQSYDMQKHNGMLFFSEKISGCR